MKGEVTGALLPSSGHACVISCLSTSSCEALGSEHLHWDTGIPLIKLSFEQCMFKETLSSVLHFLCYIPHNGPAQKAGTLSSAV